jgi:PadR family transcriptional regulator, regulatory protein PadR
MAIATNHDTCAVSMICSTMYTIMAPDRVGHFELAVLLSVQRLQDDAYSARIRADVSTHLDRDCSVGAVHATLGRLEAKQLLTSWISDPTPVRGGRAKRCYELTSAGRATLRLMKRLNTRLWAAEAAWQQ